MIIWVLCFGYGIYKFNKNEINLKLNSDEEKIVDGALELITKLYFSKSYEEFIKNLSGKGIRVINNLFKNFVSTEEIETNDFDSNIFKSIGSEDFKKMFDLSSNSYYDKGNPTEEYKKAIETYNKIKTAARNLLQNNNLLTNITDNEDFKSNCLKLLGQECFFVSYYLLIFYPQYFENEKIIPNFYGMDITLRERWIKKCQEVKENDFEIPTKSNNFLTIDEKYYNNKGYGFDHIDDTYLF